MADEHVRIMRQRKQLEMVNSQIRLMQAEGGRSDLDQLTKRQNQAKLERLKNEARDITVQLNHLMRHSKEQRVTLTHHGPDVEKYQTRKPT